ncbi:1-deoxy-D-xylulose-5-phosphate reductoisomerase [Desulfolucanica intricata]|uniref:1-deoxy-D-xylulose-5-phosphate reductoisomerase n=1 Tax=Desulfolucanica intricata TaxID=1285191 RepID=UPI000832D9A3|nr:1-deoxy-D-xylulose-5-phosphate reductoisomerase [Desulfolucanica intricata]
MTKKLVILGSTGSIGRQTLDVVRKLRHKLTVVGLAAGNNWPLLLEQINEFQPVVVAVASTEEAYKLRDALGPKSPQEIYTGLEGLISVAGLPDADTVLTAVTGVIGLSPTIAAIRAGKNIALANKETLVAAGELVMRLAGEYRIKILPVDSEHSAIWQCLNGENSSSIQKIILTASGGPFRKKSQSELAEVTVEMALAHPNWSMGKKITVDSATLMNKGLEVIEARWLFGVEYSNIQVVVHPQSIIHSMVEFKDGSVIAQLGMPDMRIPIQYALSYPDRWFNELPRLNFLEQSNLTFEPPDLNRFPCLALAFDAGKTGGTMPAVLNAANEVAVESFLNRSIAYKDIEKVVARVMDRHAIITNPALDDILFADSWAREEASRQIIQLNN